MKNFNDCFHVIETFQVRPHKTAVPVQINVQGAGLKGASAKDLSTSSTTVDLSIKARSAL